MRLTHVEPELVPFTWGAVEDWIRQSCERAPSELTVDGLRDACLMGEATLVLIGPSALHPIAAGVLEVRTMADGSKVTWILAIGGAGLRQWRNTLAAIEDQSRTQGCASVEFVGRPGWARALPDYDCNVHFRKVL